MAAIVVLLKRVAAFIVKITLAFRKNQPRDSTLPHIPGPEVSPYIRNIIQKE
jgi:hypothetical protein